MASCGWPHYRVRYYYSYTKNPVLCVWNDFFQPCKGKASSHTLSYPKWFHNSVFIYKYFMEYLIIYFTISRNTNITTIVKIYNCFIFHKLYLINNSYHLKYIIFWDITPYSAVFRERFGGNYYLYLQVRRSQVNKHQAIMGDSLLLSTASCWFPPSFSLRAWKWRQYFLPNMDIEFYRYISQKGVGGVFTMNDKRRRMWKETGLYFCNCRIW